MGKLLLVHLNPDDPQKEYIFAGRREYRMKREHLLGFQYLAAILEKKGIESEIMDQTLTRFTFSDLEMKLRNRKYIAVGFYSTTILKKKVIHYTKWVKQENCDMPILVGGPGCFGAKDYLDAGCDIVCHGEGERTIIEIMDYLQKNRKIEQVKGISYKKDRKFVTNPPQEIIKNLDDLPFPKRDRVSFMSYYDFNIFGMRRPYATVLASRGCPHNCFYCASHNFWGNGLRMRSVENVVAEIDELVKRYRVKYIRFRDDIFGGYKVDWLEKFCRFLISKRYSLRWACNFYPLSLKRDTEYFVGLLKRAGCHLFSFGLEAVDRDILRSVNRDPQTPDELAKVIRIAREKGILAVLHFLLGLPGETGQTIKERIDYMMRVKPNYVRLNRLILVEGSELARQYQIPTDQKICKFTDEEIDRYCTYLTKKFYTSPSIVIQNMKYILKNDPLWLIRAFRCFRHIKSGLGY